SNERGNTSLWVLDLPGAQRREIVVRERRYLHPQGELTVLVRDRAGRSQPARVSITGADGRSWAPDDAWRHADEAFDRHERPFEYGYFHTTGAASLTLPAGPVTIEVTRGPEYRIARHQLTI